MRFILLALLLSGCVPTWTSLYGTARSPRLEDADRLRRAARSPERWTRLFGLRGLGKLKLPPPEEARRDRDPLIRREALWAAKEAGLPVPEAAADPDPKVRMLAPKADDPSPLVRGEVPSLKDPHWYVRVKAGGSLTDPDARVVAAALETASSETVRGFLDDPRLPVVGTALERLKDEPASVERARRNPVVQANPELRKLAGLPPAADYFWTAVEPAARGLLLRTEKGDIELELFPEKAPRHVAAVTAMAAKGVYDGLIFHRVVPNFVIQGGDPTGSGWGDCGFALKDEPSRTPFLRGVVGMPNAGPDTGGCQLFIMLAPALHLNGKYTAFGRVVRGLEVVDRIEPGDRIVRAVPR